MTYPHDKDAEIEGLTSDWGAKKLGKNIRSIENSLEDNPLPFSQPSLSFSKDEKVNAFFNAIKISGINLRNPFADRDKKLKIIRSYSEENGVFRYIDEKNVFIPYSECSPKMISEKFNKLRNHYKSMLKQ